MSSVNGLIGEINGRDPKVGSQAFWNRLIGVIITAVVLGGGAMLLKHDTAIAVNTETVANLKSQIADVKNDTSLIRSDIKELSRSVRGN